MERAALASSSALPPTYMDYIFAMYGAGKGAGLFEKIRSMTIDLLKVCLDKIAMSRVKIHQ
jgi:hypothetical protein